MAKTFSKPPGQRQLRVGEELRHALAEVLGESLPGQAHEEMARRIAAALGDHGARTGAGALEGRAR